MSNQRALGQRALGIFECRGMVALAAAADAMLKAAEVRICGRHGIGSGWLTLLIDGDTAAVQTAVEAGRQEAAPYGDIITSKVVPQPEPRALAAMPHAVTGPAAAVVGERGLGILETRGLIPLIAGSDAMVKGADVELMGWTYIGGTLVHAFVCGDVGSVRAAVEAGREEASAAADAEEGGVTTLVLPQPSEGLSALFPPPPAGEGEAVGALGVVETTGYAGAVSADDGMIKGADIDIVRLTIGSGGRVGALVTGSLDAVSAAVKAGETAAARVGEINGSRVVSRPDPAVMACFGHADSPVEAADPTWRDSHLAMGFLETRSTVGLVTAMDVMLKSADVVHEGRYKVGYFLTAGVIRGDVGAVKIALDSGAAEARKHGELVAAHLIGQPFEAMEVTLPHRRLD